MKKDLKLTVIIALLGVLTGCGNSGGDVYGTGSFEATEILVSSEVNGTMQEWTVEEGMTMNEGTIVGLVDTTQLYLKKEALKRSAKGVTAARPNISTQTASLEAQLSNLKVQRDRIRRLLDAEVATQKELDDIETGIRVVESQLAAARSTLGNSSAQITAQSSAVDVQIAQVQDMIDRSVIKAPMTGTVTANYIHKGELTGAGRPLFRIADLSEMILRAYISTEELSSLKIGDTVTIQVDGKDEKKQYQGTLQWISAKSEFTPKTVQTEEERSNLVYAVKVKVKNDDYLKIGMYGEIVHNRK